MVFPGETISTGALPACPDCGITSDLEVLMSAEGYFIGTRCNCGPCRSRESDYYKTRAFAQADLDSGDFTPRGWPK